MGKPTTALTPTTIGTVAAATATMDADTHTVATPSSAASTHRASTSAAVASGTSRVWSILAASWARVSCTAPIIARP